MHIELGVINGAFGLKNFLTSLPSADTGMTVGLSVFVCSPQEHNQMQILVSPQYLKPQILEGIVQGHISAFQENYILIGDNEPSPAEIPQEALSSLQRLLRTHVKRWLVGNIVCHDSALTTLTWSNFLEQCKPLVAQGLKLNAKNMILFLPPQLDYTLSYGVLSELQKLTLPARMALYCPGPEQLKNFLNCNHGDNIPKVGAIRRQTFKLY